MDVIQQALDQTRRADETALRAQVAFKSGGTAYLAYLQAEYEAAMRRMQDDDREPEDDAEFHQPTEGSSGEVG